MNKFEEINTMVNDCISNKSSLSAVENKQIATALAKIANKANLCKDINDNELTLLLTSIVRILE